ncbi:MAG: hypothetical protein MJZ14_00460 [Paludibacteraceae bacterium]|nr:hypothetical protein [Paludibacteraceae bacterium]
MEGFSNIFLFAALLLAIVIFVLIVVLGVLVVAGVFTVTSAAVFAASGKEKRWPNLAAYIGGLLAFLIWLSIFSLVRDKYTIDTDNVFEYPRYVQISGDYQYRIELMGDDDCFYLCRGEEPLVTVVDSVAFVDSFLYGCTKDSYTMSSAFSYFSIDLRDGIVHSDSSFANLELPENCGLDKMKGGYEFYHDQRSSHEKGFWEFWTLPFGGALLMALCSGGLLRVVVAWLQDQCLEWRRKRRGKQRSEGDFSLD